MPHHSEAQHEAAPAVHEEQHQLLHAKIAQVEQRLNDLKTEQTDNAAKILAINTIIVSYLLVFVLAHSIDVVAETYYYGRYGEALAFPSFLVPFGLLVALHTLFVKRMYRWGLERTPTQKRLAMGLMVLLSAICFSLSA